MLKLFVLIYNAKH